jgi:hypothetical protein
MERQRQIISIFMRDTVRFSGSPFGRTTNSWFPGSIARIAPNELSFSSPYAAREVLAAGKGFHKTDFYGVFPPAENPDIFTETNEHAHGLKKRYASNAYSMAAMQGLSENIEDTQKLLLDRLDRKCSSPQQTCDLGDWLVGSSTFPGMMLVRVPSY